MRKIRVWWALLLIIMGISPVRADAVVLRVAIPDAYVLPDEAIAGFTALHPNITVDIVTPPASLPVVTVDADIDQDMRDFADYAALADVLFIDSGRFSQAVIDAGLMMDIEPLVRVDPDFDVQSPAFLDAFYDSGHRFALPVAVDTDVLQFERDAFDSAGAAYPESTSTLEDYFAAIRQFPSEISVISARDMQKLRIGFALKGQSLDAALASLETSALSADIASESAENPVMAIVPLSQALQMDSAVYGWSPFSGALRSDVGLAISAGSAYPQSAYQFIRYMMQFPDFARFYGGIAPADIISEPVNAAFASSLSFADSLFVPFVQAGNAQIQSGVPAAEVAATLHDILDMQQQSAANQRATPIVVMSVEPLAAGDHTLIFSVAAHYTVSFEANQALWDSLAQEFAAADPDIDLVRMMTADAEKTEGVTPNCLYNDMNRLTLQANFGLDLSPLMAADPVFAPDDFIPGTLDMVRAQGSAFAYPITLVPTILWVDAAQFEAVGLPVPYTGWTMDEFNNAVDTFAAAGVKPAIYLSDFLEFSDMMLLVAAESQPPFTYSDPVALSSFSSPDVRAALLRYIGRYRDDTVRMQKPDNSGQMSLQNATVPMYASLLSAYYINAARDTSYEPVAFPRGDDFVPVHLGIGAGIVPPQSAYPEACYRWLSTLAQHPELFFGMPVRYSQLENSALVAAQGDRLAAFYRDYAGMLAGQDVRAMDWPPYTGQLMSTLYDALYFHPDIDIDAALQAFDAQYSQFAACVVRQTPENMPVSSDVSDECARQNVLQ